MNVPTRLLLGSEWVEGSGSHEIHNPYDGSPVARVPLADPALIDRAITLAHETFARTRHQAPYERSDLLQAAARGIEKRREDFLQCLIREAGKPRSFAEAEITRAATTFQAAAEAARQPVGELLPMDGYSVGRDHYGLARRFPIGVIAAITPFNFPLNLVAHKVAPCLATGNTMVLKPALKTPLCSLLLGEVLLEAGMTPGQVNIVTCSNEHAGLLLEHPLVRMVSFTGSPAVGWDLKARAGKKKVCLELGGNAAVIVHEDADLDAAVPIIATGAFSYAGQSCISVQRILVHQPVYEGFKSRFLHHVSTRVKTGDPQDPATVVGPMIQAEARDRVRGWIQQAVEAGGRLLLGGDLEGICLRPTVLENVPRTAAVCTQEVFAPVVVLQPYTDFEQALGLVNDSTFGLQAGLFTRDIHRALRAWHQLDVGGVLVNNVPTFRVETMPYGGLKDSGFGREGVRYAMEEMTELKSLIVRSQPNQEIVL